jgi:hypothetical protein
MSHPGDYLARRMGNGRQCWRYCDRTPCRCGRLVRRFSKKSERQRVRAETLGGIDEHEADRWWMDDGPCDYCDGCEYCDPTLAYWDAWRAAQDESGRIAGLSAIARWL